MTTTCNKINSDSLRFREERNPSQIPGRKPGYLANWNKDRPRAHTELDFNVVYFLSDVDQSACQRVNPIILLGVNRIAFAGIAT